MINGTGSPMFWIEGGVVLEDYKVVDGYYHLKEKSELSQTGKRWVIQRHFYLGVTIEIYNLHLKENEKQKDLVLGLLSGKHCLSDQGDFLFSLHADNPEKFLCSCTEIKLGYKDNNFEIDTCLMKIKSILPVEAK